MKRKNIYSNFLIKSDDVHNTIISGYASVFGIVDSQNDLIIKGAFENSSVANVKLLWQHDSTKPIGVVKSLIEDKRGLVIEAEINNKITYGKDAAELIRQGAINGLSIGFNIKDFEYDDKSVRLIKKIDLIEVSIVTFPANEEASIINFKSQQQADSSLEESVDKLFLLVKKLVNLK